MTEIEDRLQATRGAEVPEPAPVADLQRRTSRRRVRLAAGGALVAFVAVVGFAMITDPDDARVDVVDEPRPAPSTPVSTTTTSTTATTSSTPLPDPTSGLVSVSGQGVEVRLDGEPISISTEPAAAAYAIGNDIVAFQDAGIWAGVFRPMPGGLVKVWDGDGVRELSAGAGVARSTLLDAGIVDGAPVALVAESTDDGPENAFETLVRIDLSDDSRTTIVRRPSWESGHQEARLLGNGDVIGLISAEGTLALARWSETTGDEPDWIVQVGFDTNLSLTLDEGTIRLIESTFQEAIDFAPVITIADYDPSDGTKGETDTHIIFGVDTAIETGLACRDWLTTTQLLCGRNDGAPGVVATETDEFTTLPLPVGSLVTVARSG